MWVASPAQHGVGLRCEDGGVHDKARVVYDQRDSLAGPDAAHALLGGVANVGQVGGAVALAGGVGTQQAAGRYSQRPRGDGVWGKT